MHARRQSLPAYMNWSPALFLQTGYRYKTIQTNGKIIPSTHVIDLVACTPHLRTFVFIKCVAAFVVGVVLAPLRLHFDRLLDR